ncbi:MAG: hypothetical protein ABWX73_08750 [Marmoricola sp.]
MRRVVVVLVALFLVNLPFVHQTLSEREVTRSGRDVEASVVDSRTINGRRFVDYRLPASIDEERVTYSARVDDATYEQARETGVLSVRVVPDEPSANRPNGEVTSSLFLVVAVIADVVLLLVALLFWRRWRRWALHEVVAVEPGGGVTLTSRGQTLTVVGPDGWSGRVQAGDRVTGSMHLVAEGDVLPGLPLSGFEQVTGSSYVARGRVLDARAGRLQLQMADGFRLAVETGGHRIRADIRDSTEVRGTLYFTPTVG